MKINSTAKINLYLEITGKDPADGYHMLDSLFQEISLSDTLDIEPLAGANSDDVSFGGIAVEGRSTVHKALDGFRALTGAKDFYRVRVQKRIPVGAGLGGGSSNAAFTLLALAKLHGMGRDALLPVATKVGSDVPFFLFGGLCRVSGKGEKIVPLKKKLEDVHFVIVWPGTGVETKWAYSLVKTYGDSTKGDQFMDFSHFNIDFLKKISYNKFQDLVFGSMKELSDAKKELDALLSPECSLMSGSGSSLVFSWSNKGAAESALAKFREKFDWPAFYAGPVYRD